LPQANFYPIWGSKDTTAKHVKDEFERVASIAKKAIERERENKQKVKEGRENPHLDTIRVIYFEEMGVADTNDNNPLKVLHPLLEPREQDRVESLCFVGLSNTSLDAAKLNRLLNVPRFDMDDSELQATVDHYNIDLRIENILTFESDCETFKDATKTTISTALVEAYRQFREYEQASPYHRDFHGPRDFYAMCKWTSSNLDTLDEVYKEQGRGESAKSWIQMMLSYFLLAIERNFSGRELPTNPAKTLDIGDIYQKNSCGIFKQLFLRQLLANNTFSSLPPRFVENKNTPARMISMNLCDKDARHLMVFVESPFYVPAVVDAITKYQEGMQIDSSKIKYLDNDQQPLASLVNNFVSYVQEGFTVILRNMEPLYPSLYDLFNQRYIPSKVDKKKVFCQITYGTTVSKVPVHSEFKCIILMDKPAPEDYRNFKDVETRWPTALLNRFEKHILTLEDLVDSSTYSLVEQAKKTLAERKLSPELYIHNWSALLLESCIARQSESDKRSIQLPVNNHQQAIKDQILTNLEKTGAIVPSKKRNVHQSLLGRESSNQDEDVTKVEDLLKNLGELYNSNYIYFLHIEYVNPSEKSLRDAMFEKFLILQTSRSIQRLILDHQASRTSRQYKTEAFVAFSFAQPFGLSIRDLIDSDETLAAHRSQVELVDHPPYSTVEDRLSKATAALESPDNHTVIFQFRQADEWRHLEEYATVVRDFMGKYTHDKLVVLLAHNGSFAESDQNQFRFESIHFHSNLKPISLDIIGLTRVTSFLVMNYLTNRLCSCLQNARLDLSSRSWEKP
jgi:hypothetical protein